MNTPRRPAILALGLLLVLAACGGTTTPTATDPDVPQASIALADTLPEASPSAAPADGGEQSPPAGPALASAVSAASIEALLGELPEPTCEEAGVYATETCEWTTTDGSTTLELTHSRDEAIGASVEAFDAHMATVMEGGDRVDGVGESAFIGRNPLSPGVRIAAFVGDGAHVWVTILAEREQAALETAAVDLAKEFVAAL